MRFFKTPRGRVSVNILRLPPGQTALAKCRNTHFLSTLRRIFLNGKLFASRLAESMRFQLVLLQLPTKLAGGKKANINDRYVGTVLKRKYGIADTE
ncbi:hypothetical protein PAAG_11231 [Paracoccidioides lutzii Pb01]|uniref:Uncharacterized protein n=1 Tax=Paracoccidioides lutzii (strain ATCC MYA-826 / Pb01) TaxID=502779 RepID=A0A0A2V7H8_PARBA|nr:hypothetical protein PAAG_11231 [Paracoccidioides lutzii Pb01]KGQ02050.1 hypothetical protein PAAG_11231 [Paracoccidioides lutzii Pb01]